MTLKDELTRFWDAFFDESETAPTSGDVEERAGLLVPKLEKTLQQVEAERDQLREALKSILDNLHNQELDMCTTLGSIFDIVEETLEKPQGG